MTEVTVVHHQHQVKYIGHIVWSQVGGCSTEGGLRVQGLVVQWREIKGARVGCSTEGGLRVQGLVVQRREV